MKKFMWAIVCSAAVASPVFAHGEGTAADSITCAEFLAMGADDRTKAVETVQMASAEGGMAADGMMESDQMGSDGMMESDQMGSDDMMESDQMGSDDMAADDMAADDMAADDMAADDMMGSDQMASDDAMMVEDTVAAVLEVCERDSNVSLADAVKDATGH